MNAQTRRSTRFAVLVLRDEDKAAARSQLFDTPLIFSVHEAKGLEYDSIVLFRFISDNCAPFHEIAEGVSAADLASGDLHYGRAKDKTDKSLEIYAFWRAVRRASAKAPVRQVFRTRAILTWP